jgi:hypothetical protein
VNVTTGWIIRMILPTMAVSGLVAAPNISSAANNTKPREIVVVGSTVKKKDGGGARARDTLIHRWQRSGSRAKGLKSKQ